MRAAFAQLLAQGMVGKRDHLLSSVVVMLKKKKKFQRSIQQIVVHSFEKLLVSFVDSVGLWCSVLFSFGVCWASCRYLLSCYPVSYPLVALAIPKTNLIMFCPGSRFHFGFYLSPPPLFLLGVGFVNVFILRFCFYLLRWHPAQNC